MNSKACSFHKRIFRHMKFNWLSFWSCGINICILRKVFIELLYIETKCVVAIDPKTLQVI